MTKRFKFVLTLAAACVAIAPATSQAATKSTVTIAYHTGSSWVGFVKSNKQSCKNKRKVTLYLELPGQDFKIGSDKSEPSKGGTYAWFVPHTDPAPGAYYAKMPADDGCAGDKSKDYDYPEDQP